MRQELEDLLERWPIGRNLDLNGNSVVYIVGGYKGITTELINEMYHPKLIRAFEPQEWAFKILREVALAHPESIEAYNYGLGNRADTLPMGEWGTDACSFINVGPGSREQGEGLMVPAEWTMQDVANIDLMIVNIEGGEFELIPYMRSRDLLPRINSLATQWHPDLREDLVEAVMDAEIDRLIIEDGFTLRQDDRPAWTYMTRWHG
jgi:FkbM family methyltransferase